MAAPLTDIHVKHVIELGLKVLRSNPDHHLKDILGDAKADPHAALYGQRAIDQCKHWVMNTKIPVTLGFDVNEAEMPAVTIHLSGSVPRQQAIGDESLPGAEPLDWTQKEVVVPAFQPASAVRSSDNTSIALELPKDMPFEQQQLVLPGLIMRDGQGREYDIAMDADGRPVLVQRDDDYPLDQIDLTKLEVISPVIDTRYSRGGMVYDETVTVAVHGHGHRQESLWLYYIVMWSLLKFRPVLAGTFGLDLSTPVASDLVRDDMYQPTQVWRRFITLTCTTIWTWESARQKDVLGLLLSVYYDRADSGIKK